MAASLRRAADRFEAGQLSAEELAKGLKLIAGNLGGRVNGQDVQAIFRVWVAETKRDPVKTKLTRDREEKIKARLREGYSADDVIVAIKNCAASAFHGGDNDRGQAFNDITLICRNGSKLESFRDMGPVRPGAGQTRQAEQRVVDQGGPGGYRDVGW